MVKSNIIEFINKAILIHGNKYYYNNGVYQNSKTNIEIICPIHGSFWQTPNNHVQGYGCKQCFNDSIRSNIFEFIDKAKKIHGNLYNYCKVEYFNSDTKVEIDCYIHGSFWQTPCDHLSGAGCRKCADEKKKLTSKKFIEKAKILHKNKFNESLYYYSDIIYLHTNIKVSIGCYIHGIFKQTPHSHLDGSGCPKCAHNYTSRKETLWLNSLNIPNDKEHRQVKLPLFNGSFIKVDGYNPTTNTIFEFWGDYWHGNPKKYNPDDLHPMKNVPYKNLYECTLQKIKYIFDSGYNLVQIWESDWEN